MQSNTRNEKRTTCHCDHYLPLLSILQSTAFNLNLAAFYDQLGLSGDEIVDFVLDELYFRNDGELFDHERIFVDIEAPEYTPDKVFGKSPRRSVKRYLVRARSNYSYRLQRRIFPMVMLMHFAKEIYLCRTQGVCASRK